MTTTAVPIDDGLFTWPADEPHLLGGECASCQTVTFPAARVCPACAGDDIQRRELSREGTLWSFTVQGFRPKSPPYAGDDSPETFEPYGVGYVELPGEVRVESRLTEADPEKLRIGMPMRLEIIPFRTADGRDTVTFAFAPTEEQS